MLAAADDATLPALRGVKSTGAVTVPPASVAFVADAGGAPVCN